ncbi:YpdA family putative bacillithiol disulfide reductase [Mesobacillus harenae]|uniref:YpdA family putative bacillithiol disulfide reductase n=1 Tax=Mesobacillus harenae TaxID=2213203 RepID=UPI00157FDE52|nr:YpdA family putative bacillithiol disulfide reductase [Mesobacillus harenae]
MENAEVIIVGGGPCGLSAAIALKKIGKAPLVIEKGNIVNAIYNYPTHQTFFSSSEKLSIGEVPFITENYKPKRNQALTYYREVVRREELDIRSYEEVTKVNRLDDGAFCVSTSIQEYITPYVIIATGYYDHPNYIGIPGEELTKVSHYFKEAHPHFNQDVVVIGGKNSSIDAAIELEKARAKVTVLYRGREYSKSIKPWILPEFESLVRHGNIAMEFGAQVKQITPTTVVYERDGQEFILKNDFVYAMTGYHPDHKFLQKMGVDIDSVTGRPSHNLDTMETNVKGIFIAGVLAAGNNANEIFIENGRFHGGQIAKTIKDREK